MIKDSFIVNFEKIFLAGKKISLAIKMTSSTMAILLICSTLQAMVEDDSNNRLGHATKSGDLAEIESLIGEGADVNSATKIDGQLKTPLVIAIYNNDLKTVLFLIMKGAFVDLPEQKDMLLTPLHYAVMLGYENILNILLDGPTRARTGVINVRDRIGNTLLHYAARQGNEEITRLLLIRSADINAKNQLGYTPLFEAVINGHIPLIRLFIEIEAVTHIPEARGVHSVLAAACSNGQAGAVDLLLEKCKFTLTDIEESLERLNSFVRHLNFCCTNKSKEAKCAKCLKNEGKISHIFDKLNKKQRQLKTV